MLRFRYRPEDDANFKPPLQGPRKLVQIKIPARSPTGKQENKNNVNSSAQTSANPVDVNKTQKSATSSLPQQTESPGTVSNERKDQQSPLPPETPSKTIYHAQPFTKLTPKIFPDSINMAVDVCKNVSTSHMSSRDNNIHKSSLHPTTGSDQNIPTAKCLENPEKQPTNLRQDSNTHNYNDTFNNMSTLLQIAVAPTVPRRKSCFSISPTITPSTESSCIPACSPSPVTMETKLPSHHIQPQDISTGGQQKGCSSMSNVHHPRRRKRRPMNGVKTVDVIRGTLGYGFTISGQGPCTLSCIVSGSPAEAIGLKPGDFLLAVNGENVSKAPHDEVVRMIGTSVGTLTLQVAENVNNSDSSDEDIPQRQKFRHPHRSRPRQVGANRVLKDHNSQQVEQVTATAVKKKPQISESLQSAALLKQKPPTGAGRRNVWDQENTGFTMQEPNLAFRNVYLNSHTSHFNNVQKVDKTDWVQKTVTNPADGQTASNAELSNRLHATRSSRSGRQSAPCNIAMSVDPEESEEEWSIQCDPNADKHFVVGYVGTIEMPGDKNSQHARLQSFHNAVRRLRLEKKIHTLVALTISVNGVKLTNAVRKVLAVYPVHRIMFCGICPDDNLYFGIVTSNCSSDGNESIRLEYAPSFSCHVFKVNTDIQAHYMHAQKARVFQFECTRSRDLRRCFEFPQTALPVIEPISALYRDRQNSQDNFPITQVFNEPSVTPVQNVAVNSSVSSSSSSCSNSDSGLGFGRDDSRNEAVFVVDMNQLPNDQYRMTNGNMNRHSLPSQSLHQHLSPSVDTMPTPQSAFRSTSAANMHAQTKIISNNEDPKQGRLTLRAMPDPVLDLPSPFEQPICSNTKVSDQNSSTTGILSYKYRSKQGVEHRSRSRETVSKMNSTNQQRLSSVERKFEPRPLSAPYHQLSNGKLTVVNCSSNTDFLDDKLSPRATPCNSKFKIRSPSAPPPGCATVEDSEFEQNVRRPLEEIFAIFDCDRNSETSVESATVRRFSEGFAAKLNKADSKPPINSSGTHKWKKVGSFRRPKISKLSHSHESLVASGNDGLISEKLGTANSINSIVNHDDGSNGCGREVSRVAAWAVSFNRLLEDPAGVEVFTDFLQKEFSEENIHFWLAVDDFKRSLDVNKRNSFASEIFAKHLGPGASEPVNVDSLARQTAEQLLGKPTSTMFDAAQRQIFQLMKQDSYARFLKSELYKTHLMAEMESKLPTSRTAVFTAVAMLHSKTSKEVDKKKSSKGKEEEKRRWSLLPWKQKTSKPSEMQKFRKFSKDESKKKPSLATMDLSLMRKEVVQGRESAYGNEDLRFCRVLLPDNSTAVVCAKSGQSIHQVLSHLFDKRNLTLESTEVFLVGSDKPLDLAEDMSILGSKEVLVERRTFFRVELPNQKIIGVKAKPNKLIYDVFRPILQKYGYKIDNISLQMTSDQGSLDLQIPVSSINDQQVLVVPKEDLLETGSMQRTSRRRSSLFGYLRGSEKRVNCAKGHVRLAESISAPRPISCEQPCEELTSESETFNSL
ncbi:regulator of G-protein signaling 12 isoform X3 [Octopus sinensis]|uniref:Regulator of G-protein signaling 12 isoform X3 n=1 Tax=Octopus sinensis TaxID=2607531 RepID=A0A6P7T229_9MOLL|nr:regulator of G-protein signaling 12 isoform X3 [Octopus sinensis]